MLRLFFGRQLGIESCRRSWSNRVPPRSSSLADYEGIIARSSRAIPRTPRIVRTGCSPSPPACTRHGRPSTGRTRRSPLSATSRHPANGGAVTSQTGNPVSAGAANTGAEVKLAPCPRAARRAPAIWPGIVARVDRDATLLVDRVCRRARARSPFFIASTTKLYTTAIVLRFVERGRLTLDDRLVDLVEPGLVDRLHVLRGRDHTARDPIRHLLRQTSGLPDYFLGRRPGGSTLERTIRAGTTSLDARRRPRLGPQLGPAFAPGTPRQGALLRLELPAARPGHRVGDGQLVRRRRRTGDRGAPPAGADVAVCRRGGRPARAAARRRPPAADPAGDDELRARWRRGRHGR